MLGKGHSYNTSAVPPEDKTRSPFWSKGACRWLVVLALLFVFLQYQLWFAQGGLPKTQHLRDQLHQQQQTNMNLQARNQHIRHQIQLWQHSEATVQTLARQELGMIKPGEHYYQF